RAGTAEKFIPYHGGSFVKGSMDAGAADRSAREGQPNSPSSFSGLSLEDQHVEFEQWRARLVANGLEIFAEHVADDEELWEHYASSRRAGVTPHDIGPPSFTRHMMGAPTSEVRLEFPAGETPQETTNNVCECSQHVEPGDPERVPPAAGACQGELDFKPVDTPNPETQTKAAGSESLDWPHHWSCAGGILASVRESSR
ncbi:MAG: hypothetical protein P8Q23_00925, partial [Paracoccaceae bacterium]|nr:hypothetical protein [Paracoccaceae bacterium]